MEAIKQSWWKPATEVKGGVGCLCCPGTTDILSLDTHLYGSGWQVTKNGEEFYQADYETEFHDCKTLAQIEEMIGKDTENEYLAIIWLPLRGGTYQRHSKNNWVVIEKNEGYA